MTHCSRHFSSIMASSSSTECVCSLSVSPRGLPSDSSNTRCAAASLTLAAPCADVISALLSLSFSTSTQLIILSSSFSFFSCVSSSCICHSLALLPFSSDSSSISLFSVLMFALECVDFISSWLIVISGSSCKTAGGIFPEKKSKHTVLTMEQRRLWRYRLWLRYLTALRKILDFFPACRGLVFYVLKKSKANFGQEKWVTALILFLLSYCWVYMLLVEILVCLAFHLPEVMFISTQKQPKATGTEFLKLMFFCHLSKLHWKVCSQRYKAGTEIEVITWP